MNSSVLIKPNKNLVMDFNQRFEYLVRKSSFSKILFLYSIVVDFFATHGKKLNSLIDCAMSVVTII